jgi:hypothetical protein
MRRYNDATGLAGTAASAGNATERYTYCDCPVLYCSAAPFNNLCSGLTLPSVRVVVKTLTLTINLDGPIAGIRA